MWWHIRVGRHRVDMSVFVWPAVISYGEESGQELGEVNGKQFELTKEQKRLTVI